MGLAMSSRHMVSNVAFICCGGSETCTSIVTTELPRDFPEKSHQPLALPLFSCSFLTCSLQDELCHSSRIPKSKLLLCSFGNYKTKVLAMNVTRQDSWAGSARDPIAIRQALSGTGYSLFSFQTSQLQMDYQLLLMVYSPPQTYLWIDLSCRCCS